MSENRNLLLAIILSAAVIFGWEYFVAMPQMKTQKPAPSTRVEQVERHPSAPSTQAPAAGEGPAHLTRAQALKAGGPRIAIETPTVDGSLRLKGARIDDLRLRHYHETIDPRSPEIVLLSPTGTNYPYYAQFGWVAPEGSHIPVPGDSTPWRQTGGGVLSPGHPVTLVWDNGKGLVFTRTISVDDQYLFTVTDSVKNEGAQAQTLYPYAYVARDGIPNTQHYWVVHEGFIGVAGDTLKDASYGDFKPDTPPTNFSATGGWVGITDKYWMAAVIPPQDRPFDATYHTTMLHGVQAFQADYRLSGQIIPAGGSASLTNRLFAGAKVVSILNSYRDNAHISRFDLAIDWGWFFFFTKPIFYLLDFFYRYVGNFGIAILLLTLAVKILFFPIADRQYKSMTRMKKLQPEMQRIRERFADDKVRQQQEMMELYKREKVNPVSGCLPILLQIPVFFSLYKVLFVTIEMRHAPFFGWIQDLSAADPTSFLNLYGLLPYSIPDFIPWFLHIGVWPTLMGISQWVQTKMNPAPADPVQAKMFTYLPVFYTALMSSFPAGLVIYWTWNNVLTILQQYVMMRRQGVPVHLIENLKMPRWLANLRQRISGAKPAE